MDINAFQDTVYTYFKENARTLPWRSNPTPYNVFISEVMLQQTQVPRVIIKFEEFMQAFPSFEILAASSIPDLLRVWSGLGYNRRALNLKKAAQVIVEQHQGKLPQTIEELDALPGIGPATAASISAFAFNKPVVFIETNIRSVFLHHFFTGIEQVTDAQLLPLIQQSLDTQNPRKWYSALMDYGSMLKKKEGNASRLSKHYTKQSKFIGSDRQIRGALLKLLLVYPTLTQEEIFFHLPFDQTRITSILQDLKEEGFIAQEGKSIALTQK